jgi:undecaprenyl-diphosphatase
MLESLSKTDQSILLSLNGLHAPFFDSFFYYATRPVYWLPLYILLLYLVIRMFRWKTITLVIGIIFMVAASDQLANLSKQEVKRLRPTHEPAIANIVHTVNEYRGGQYGFYSAHASTNFAIAIFLTVLLRKRYRWLPAVLIIYALIMSYSRIYLGVHYPGDILAGAFIGCFLGYLFAKLTGFVIGRQSRCETNG